MPDGHMSQPASKRLLWIALGRQRVGKTALLNAAVRYFRALGSNIEVWNADQQNRTHSLSTFYSDAAVPPEGGLADSRVWSQSPPLLATPSSLFPLPAFPPLFDPYRAGRASWTGHAWQRRGLGVRLGGQARSRGLGPGPALAGQAPWAQDQAPRPGLRRPSQQPLLPCAPRTRPGARPWASARRPTGRRPSARGRGARP